MVKNNGGEEKGKGKGKGKDRKIEIMIARRIGICMGGCGDHGKGKRRRGDERIRDNR